MNDLENNVLTLKCRHNAMLYAIGELIWYWSGRNDVDFIDHFSKFWRNISDDGKTANSAYGYIIKYKHGFDQLECVINELKSRFTDIYILYDNDFQSEENHGRIYGKHLSTLFGLKQIEIPDKYKSKDPSDLCKNYGREVVKTVILTLLNI